MSRIHEFLKNDSEYTYPNSKHCGVNGDVEEHAVDAVVKTITDGLETILSDVVDDVFKNINFNKTNTATSNDNMHKDNECKCTAQRKISNAVNHPSHYQGKKFEVIDIIEDYELNFNKGNALKYLLRAGHKDDYIQDLQKACWYLQREIDAFNQDKENKQR